MFQSLKKMFALVAVLSLTFSGTSFADSSEVAALQSQVKDLMGKVNSLERQVGRMGAAPQSAYIPDSDSGGGLIKTAQNINMGGHIDVQYNMDFNQPHRDSVSARNGALRVYDNNSNSFALNAAELYFENPAEEVGEAGFRIDVQFGQDAAVTSADGDGDLVDLQQAYVEYIAGTPFGDSDILPDSIKLTAGRFVTLAGFEVIEGPANWNISRNVAYGFSIPFTHTGIRSNFGLFNDYFDVYLGLNNGWDQAVDINTAKTLELGLGYSPLDNLSIFHAFYWGGEKDGTNNGKRWVLTNTATLEVTDKLTLATEMNYGAEHDIPDATRLAATPNVTRSNGETSADWYSFTGYAHYQHTDKLGFTARYELFRDDELARTGLTDTIFGQTYTAEYKVTDNMIARAEFRHDKSNDDEIFGNDTSRTSLGGQMIYLI